MKTIKEVPLVFAVDDNYSPFLSVALRSIVDNASSNNFYSIFILNTGISDTNRNKLCVYNSDNVKINFVDVADCMGKMDKEKIHLRDYYTKAIYYRIFIPSLFPQYDKILYLDCDLVVLEDIANFYNCELDNKILGVVPEETMTQFDVFGVYSEKVLGVDRNKYFNSGVLLINCKEFISEHIEEKFIMYMSVQEFKVAPDQDYLNVLCKDKVKYFSVGWNKTPFLDMDFNDSLLKLIHYKLNFKPWHYNSIRYQEYFWKYAERTEYYEQLIEMRKNFTDEEKRLEEKAFETLKKTAVKYVNDKNIKTL